MIDLVLLDSTVLIGLCREAVWAQNAIKKLSNQDASTRFLCSIVSVAEVVAVAERSGWGEQKMQRLEDVFNEIPTVTYNERRVAYTYADLSNWTQGAASSRIVSEPSPKPARKMQENDLWIAATAHCLGATLVTADKDFCHLKNIWFSILYVDQSDLHPQ